MVSLIRSPRKSIVARYRRIRNSVHRTKLKTGNPKKILQNIK